ncbi:unnamed protein product [Allacma fusca]|uniref:FMN hydroxy acid dehydrogenase domain-containing protein n=1 Tax=Allacma fusca TaxID=39272 RepID=A0A8J2L8R0_9HEXA|nr:unnamed protein product [Allacma fusca]
MPGRWMLELIVRDIFKDLRNTTLSQNLFKILFQVYEMPEAIQMEKEILDFGKLICVADFEKAASKILTNNTYEYYKSGADDGYVLADNKLAYKRWFIKPRILRNVTTRHLNSKVLNGPVAFPIGCSPTAMQKLAHPLGELGIVKGNSIKCPVGNSIKR